MSTQSPSLSVIRQELVKATPAIGKLGCEAWTIGFLASHFLYALEITVLSPYGFGGAAATYSVTSYSIDVVVRHAGWYKEEHEIRNNVILLAIHVVSAIIAIAVFTTISAMTYQAAFFVSGIILTACLYAKFAPEGFFSGLVGRLVPLSRNA